MEGFWKVTLKKIWGTLDVIPWMKSGDYHAVGICGYSWPLNHLGCIKIFDPIIFWDKWDKTPSLVPPDWFLFNISSILSIWSNYSDLTRPIFPQIGGLVREIRLLQENLGWWNIVLWPVSMQAKGQIIFPNESLYSRMLMHYWASMLVSYSVLVILIHLFLLLRMCCTDTTKPQKAPH